MTTFGDEQFLQEAETCKEAGKRHFCDCRDLACPLNPNNPRNREAGRGCDGCIRKCLALGEIPACFFNAVGPWGDDWDDFSYAGFVRHCQSHGTGADA